MSFKFRGKEMYLIFDFAKCCWSTDSIVVRLGKHAHSHGRNVVGTRGRVPLTFLHLGDIICHVPPLFSLRVCIWRGFKTKCDVCHVLCEAFFMLDVTHSHVDVETEFGSK